MQMSDIIAVLSLFVAIFAAMAIPFGLYIEKQTKDLAAAQERLSETLEQLAIQNESFSETVQAVGTIVRHTASRDQFLSGIIKCLLDCNPTLVDRAPFYINATERIDRKITEGVNSLLIFSASADERLSAFRAAANQNITLQSLRKMQLATKLYKDYRPEISSCVSDLMDRLNTSAKR